MLGCGGMTANAASAIQQNTNAAPHSAQPVAIVASGHACSAGVTSTSSAVGSSNADATHHCCKKSSPEAAPNTQPPNPSLGTSIGSARSSSGMMSDCPLAGARSAVVSKSRGVEVNAEQAVAYPYRHEQNFLEQPTPLSAAPRLPNRGHTYLRCCVFLI